MGRGVRMFCGLATTVVLLFASGSPAAAKTYKPTRKDDPIPGKCKPEDCSLREAFLAANSTFDVHDTIILGKGTYEMELPYSQGNGQDGNWWTFGSTVRGKGSGRTTLDANGLDTVMQLGNDTESNRLEGVRITGGFEGSIGAGGILGAGGRSTLKDVEISENTGTGAGGGASMLPAISLTIIDSRITDNSVAGGAGGGLYLNHGSAAEVIKAKIRGSVISGNDAFFGGGIYTALQSVSVKNSTVAGNEATEGGGLDIVSNTNFVPRTKIGSSTISGNSAGKGGGVLIDGNQPFAGLMKPDVTLANSTVATNTATAEAGGILADNAATVTLDNVTVAYNAADFDNSGGGVAGGIYQHSGATFAVGDSIVGSNTVGSSGSGSQCGGNFTGDPAFVIQSGAGTGTCMFAPGIVAAGDLRLGVLTANGGPTETVGLRSQGPALGLSDDCPKEDQRGRLRPEENCDSGAFERP
jgi:hypothetical protein